jgi:hypothetical protein
MTWILRIRNWQLFILLLGIPMLSGMILMFVYHPTDIMLLFNDLTIINTISISLIIFWAYCVGTIFYKLIPIKSNLSLIIFKFSIGGILFGVVLFGISLFGNSLNLSNSLIWSIAMLATCSSVYTVYFVASTIKTIEFNKKIKFSQLLPEMLLLLFAFPIGIWFIQPKVNEIYQKYLARAL